MRGSISRGLAAAFCAAAILGGSTAAMAGGSTPVTKGWTKIVRGVNGTNCDATAIGSGNQPPAKPTEDLTDLSVSCSQDPKVTVTALRAPLPNAHACVTTLDALRRVRPNVTIVADPAPGNGYHCLLDNITPRQFVSGATYQP